MSVNSLTELLGTNTLHTQVVMKILNRYTLCYFGIMQPSLLMVKELKKKPVIIELIRSKHPKIKNNSY